MSSIRLTACTVSTDHKNNLCFSIFLTLFLNLCHSSLHGWKQTTYSCILRILSFNAYNTQSHKGPSPSLHNPQPTHTPCISPHTSPPSTSLQGLTVLTLLVTVMPLVRIQVWISPQEQAVSYKRESMSVLAF